MPVHTSPCLPFCNNVRTYLNLFFDFIVCSYINERNRQRNVIRAEQALKVVIQLTPECVLYV